MADYSADMTSVKVSMAKGTNLIAKKSSLPFLSSYRRASTGAEEEPYYSHEKAIYGLKKAISNFDLNRIKIMVNENKHTEDTRSHESSFHS